MSESKPKKNRKSCILTDSGRKKLVNALNEKYSSNYSAAELERQTGIHRDVISKILQKPQETALHKSLDTLFSFLGIDIEDSDFENPPKAQVSQRRHNPSPTSPKSDDSILLTSDSEELKDALRELNYNNQDTLFTESVGAVEPAGAFLIHGKSGYGQRWLVNRLSYKVPDFTDAFYCSLCFQRHRKNIQKLWENLAQIVGSCSPSPQDIVEAIYQHWQTQTVMLCFRNVDLVGVTDLNHLLNELWRPLVNKVQNSDSPADKHPLLLFLIDNYGKQKKLGISFVSQLDLNQPHIPVELEELELFKNLEIKRWVRTQKQLFSPQLKMSVQISVIINDIIERNSAPENALKAICSWCNLDWYEDIEKGLKL